MPSFFLFLLHRGHRQLLHRLLLRLLLLLRLILQTSRNCRRRAPLALLKVGTIFARQRLVPVGTSSDGTGLEGVAGQRWIRRDGWGLATGRGCCRRFRGLRSGILDVRASLGVLGRGGGWELNDLRVVVVQLGEGCLREGSGLREELGASSFGCEG
uniref:(northern house mosquito) hypothetical protein n=1 Tax=Culex pipiens TaxID=7175 RepID=A0A8D8FJN7_CULPI